ncbi:MAG: hypothetical protein KGD64_03485 [Candidatus Heimdallarchaeota archaeon]|nr:hypothetical protein [Candidatus Heimdallarchaeota archaeon]
MITVKTKIPTVLIITLLFFSIFCNLIVSADNKVSISNVTSNVSHSMKTSYCQPEEVNSYIVEQFGDQFLFWTNIPELVQVRGTLLAIGNWSYIYMANETIELLGENASIAKCEALSYEFDLVIYPNAIEVAGSPDGKLGDIDNDPHVTLFLAPYVRYFGDNSVLGYYDYKDEEVGNPYSNNREMVYVESERPLVDTYCIITHELNHMIWGNNEFDEAEFLIEGLANYAVDYNEYSFWVTDAVTTSFTNHPEISLLYFVREYGVLWDSSYGQAYLFVTYLADRFGNDFTKSLVSMDEDGAEAVEVALSQFGYELTFNEVYLDWITACTIDDTTFDGGIYGFESVDYKIQTQTGIGIFSDPVEKQDMKHNYYGFDVKTTYSITDNFTFIIENPYPYALGISIAFKDVNGWNVTQYFNTEKSKQISFYVEGGDIQQAFVITSLMSPDTPEDFGVVYSLTELQSEFLDYSFYKGRFELEESSGFISLLAVFSLLAAVLVRKRMSGKIKKESIK